MMTGKELLERARQARQFAYAPYSRFAVGAALWTEAGEVYEGCNIENASYGLSNCAERTAVFKALSTARSDSQKTFKALAVIGDTDRPLFPCGACRQVLSEFCPPDMPVYAGNLRGEIQETTIGEILPTNFGAADLKS